MATTCYFDETIRDQGGKGTMELEFGRSSFYANCQIPSGVGEDSIYITVDEKMVIMDRATAKKFVEALISVGRYHNLID
jgi:hypothetical protein